MSLLTPTESVTARIATDAGALAAHLRNAIVLANRITGHALDLPTAELNEWLNARPMEQRFAEFTAHGETGDALNEAAFNSEVATGAPNESLGRVDTRSVLDKLLDQGRTLDIVNGAFVVADIPQPEPEPEPEGTIGLTEPAAPDTVPADGNTP
jgi:hypothetical protein